MDGLAELQSLSALAKVGEMLRNHLDVDQPALAEFVIHLAKRSRDLEDFGRLLDENGAELGFDFVGQLYRTILALDPPSKGIRNDPEAARKADPGDTNDDILEESGGDRRRRSPSRSPEKARRDRRSRSREGRRRSPSRSPDRRDRRRRSPRRSRSRSRDGHRRRRSRSRDRRGRRSPNRSRSRSRDDRRRPKRSLSPIQKELPPAAPEPPSGVGFARRRYITDLDRWEAQQLLKTGALSATDRTALRAEIEEAPEEPDIYVNPTPPDFLRGQTIRSGIALSPIRLAAKPEGSLSRTIAAAVAAQREAPSAPGPPARGQGPGGAAGGMHFPSAPDGADSVPHPPPGPSVPIAEQRKGLPIFRLREEIVNEICSNKIVIVLGETGSGKTTQIPQYLCEAGFCDYAAFLKAISSRTREVGEDNSRRSGEKRMIGITQPRRVSAISVARRVAEEFGCSLGAEVGYSIRFRDETSAKTVIKFMTDGMLLREILADPGLSAYSTIMLDEAHERTIATDVLFSLLKETSSARRDFRLVVTSATLEAEKFSEYFFSAPIFRIPGRAFPVEVLHAREEEADYLERALATVLQIHLNEPPGDILLFLTGQDDIERACSALEGRLAGLKRLRPPPLAVLPVFSALPVEIQQQIFLPAPPGTRKCVVATNIAEASITIDGILYVVDPGLCKLKSYDPRTGVESLVISPISQANARQRAGRAGRTAPGKCFRLYTEAAFREEMLPTPVPEIQRSNLLSVVIILKSMGINDFLNFDFMDRPSSAMLVDSLDILFHLGALDTEGLLTRLGRRMAQFPVDPCLAKMLLFSAECGVADAIATIVAMLSVQNIFYRPAERREKADAARAKFFQPEGDLAALVAVYEAWARSGHSQHYCYQNFLQEIRKQLIIILDRYGPGRRGEALCTKGPSDSSATGPLGRMEKIQRSVLSGLFHHAARRGEDGYRTLLDEQVVLIHPSSCLHRRSPDYVVYFELVLTTREYMRDLTVVRPSWLSELAPTLYSTVPRAGPGTRGAQRSSGAPAVAPIKIKPLHNRLLKDQDEWRLAKRKL